MEIDYSKIIHSIVDCLVVNHNDIDIQTNEEEKNINISIFASSENISRLIGKNGRTANIIRELISIIGKENNKYTHVYFKNKVDSNTKI